MTSPTNPQVPSEMSTSEIKQEIQDREAWEERARADPDFGGGGSPFEWHYERLEDLDAELLARGIRDE